MLLNIWTLFCMLLLRGAVVSTELNGTENPSTFVTESLPGGSSVKDINTHALGSQGPVTRTAISSISSQMLSVSQDGPTNSIGEQRTTSHGVVPDVTETYAEEEADYVIMYVYIVLSGLTALGTLIVFFHSRITPRVRPPSISLIASADLDDLELSDDNSGESDCEDDGDDVPIIVA